MCGVPLILLLLTVIGCCEQALLFADDESDFRYLPRRTAGFVALGSPFSGTKMQSLANVAARLLSPVGSHRGVLDMLGYENPLLRDKLREFCRLLKTISIPIFCFFEAFDTDYGRRFGIPGIFRGTVCTNNESRITLLN